MTFTRTTFVHEVTHLKSDEKQATFMNESLAFRHYAQWKTAYLKWNVNFSIKNFRD